MKKPKFNRQYKPNNLPASKKDEVINVSPDAAEEDTEILENDEESDLDEDDDDDEYEDDDDDEDQSPSSKPAQRLPKLTPLQVMDGDTEKEIHLPQVFTRHVFHHGVRWIAFIAIILLDGLLVLAGIHTHLNSPTAGSMTSLGRELFSYFLVFLANFGIVPSVVLEANKVECTDEKLILHTLVFKKTLAWDQIKSVSNPLFLKFAIIKTDKFFYLLNKRDIGRFYELLQILRAKTGMPSN